jgi:hypothetical protein
LARFVSRRPVMQILFPLRSRFVSIAFRFPRARFLLQFAYGIHRCCDPTIHRQRVVRFSARLRPKDHGAHSNAGNQTLVRGMSTDFSRAAKERSAGTIRRYGFGKYKRWKLFFLADETNHSVESRSSQPSLGPAKKYRS